LDTIGITDPSLVSIDEDAVLAEGAMLQSHEVKNGILSFSLIRIDQRSSTGPYALLKRGTMIKDGDEVLALTSSKQRKSDAPIKRGERLQPY
ncbi:hypothetical protein PSY31_22815, partial [Shigella flexneri]|nr:hypothetical protein [Shigella flexneri]